MASDAAKVTSDENASSLTNDCLIRLKSLQFDGKSLLFDENGKLEWNGSFEELKDFVDTKGLKGSCSSPGGYMKLQNRL